MDTMNRKHSKLVITIYPGRIYLEMYHGLFRTQKHSDFTFEIESKQWITHEVPGGTRTVSTHYIAERIRDHMYRAEKQTVERIVTKPTKGRSKIKSCNIKYCPTAARVS